MTNSVLEKTGSIHTSAVIHPSAQIAEGVSIGPNVVIGKDVKIGNMKLLGKDKNVLKIDVREGNEVREGILFASNCEGFQNEIEKMGLNFPNLLLSGGEISADIVYQAKINEWKGNKTVQLIITNFRVRRGDNNV